jgi:hypothetical protein
LLELPRNAVGEGRLGRSRRSVLASVQGFVLRPVERVLDVIPEELEGSDSDALQLRFDGHELLLWDNYPANDFGSDKLYLGPLRGRDPRLAEGNLRGIVANGMVQAVPSKLALATVAEWAREPSTYDPVVSYEVALRKTRSGSRRGAPPACSALPRGGRSARRDPRTD